MRIRPLLDRSPQFHRKLQSSKPYRWQTSTFFLKHHAYFNSKLTMIIEIGKRLLKNNDLLVFSLYLSNVMSLILYVKLRLTFNTIHIKYITSYSVASICYDTIVTVKYTIRVYTSLYVLNVKMTGFSNRLH